jgi:4-amino-4-deoxy-L-arabinose transferase-like glycosyltransferase
MVVCTLLMTFFITLYNLRQDSLWNDEAWTAWAVRSLYIHDTLERVRGDVHPPLYFLVLSGLGRLTGDSVLALRWPSALFGLIGLAATYAIGKRLFDSRTGLMALVILATHSFLCITPVKCGCTACCWRWGHWRLCFIGAGGHGPRCGVPSCMG